MNDPQPTPPPSRSTPYRVRSESKSKALSSDAAAGDVARDAEDSADETVHAIRSVRPSSTQLLNVGYGNLVAASRVIAIVAPVASPMRRLRREAADRGKLVDATEGRRTRSILILDSDHVVLSAILPDTLAARLQDGDAERGA